MVPAPGLSPVTAILTGPTATGKTALAIEFARKRGDIEILNADSMLVYREMNIGTAKPTHEEQAGIPHHLIDIRNPDETFTAGAFVREVEKALSEVHARGRRALVTGGTGFYLKALLFGQWEAPAADPALRAELEKLTTSRLFDEVQEHDPAAATRIGPNDRYRLVRAIEILRATGRTLSDLQATMPAEPDARFRLLVIDRPTEELERRIGLRTRAMLEAGLVDEVQTLSERFPDARALNAVGYRQVVQFLRGEKPSGRKLRPGLEGLADEVELATRQLVKQQRTWFRAQKYAENFILERDREALLRQLEAIYQ